MVVTPADSSFPAATEDHLFGKKFLREIYQKADPSITTSVTVPILWDKKTETIVNNTGTADIYPGIFKLGRTKLDLNRILGRRLCFLSKPGSNFDS